ncbi:MAG: NYN domain-containing protein [Candidatus Porifericomitaceae bacterium WSBS_2022_MAG_OTU9]
MQSLRTYVYIDGLNLYYRALRNCPELKWLNVEVLCKCRLSPEYQINKINYYTAPVLGTIDPGAPKRQAVYWKALETLPSLEIHKGRMQAKEKILPLVYKDDRTIPLKPRPHMAQVWKCEEKGSDVALGAHLVRDACKGEFDVAVVITNDTDLYEPIRIVAEELSLPVGLLTPVARPAGSLQRITSFVRRIDRNRLLRSQFPDAIPGTTIVKNREWFKLPDIGVGGV